jgi:AraC-like DNA-binding protein
MSSSRVFVFADPQQYQAAIRGATVEVLPATGGNFRAKLMQIDFHRLWLQRGRESLPRIMNGPAHADRAGIEFPIGTDQPIVRHRGIDVAPGEIVFADTDTVSRRSFASCDWGSMSLTLADLAMAGRALVGRELTRPSAMCVTRPAPALMTHLLTLHAGAAELAETAPEKLAHPQVARSLEQGLTRAMVRCLAEGTPVKIRAATCRHSAVMARFEELLEANMYESLYVAEICAAIGVTARMLRVCCHEYLGMGPVRYLWLRRMHLARRALLLADSMTATVTGIATGHGFWELGRFSVEYRALFGESPSTTLQRPPAYARAIRNRPADLPQRNFA